MVGWGGPCNCPTSLILLFRGWLGGWAAGCLYSCQDTEYISHPPPGKIFNPWKGKGFSVGILLLSTWPLLSSIHLPGTPCSPIRQVRESKNKARLWTVGQWRLLTSIHFTWSLSDQEAWDTRKSHHCSQPHVLCLASTHMILILPRLVLKINAQGKYPSLPTHFSGRQFRRY